MAANRAWLLNSRPGADGMVPGNFRLETVPLPEIGSGEVLLRSDMVSVDPYMRGRMDEIKGPNYVPQFELGQPISGVVGSTVVASKHPDFKEGDVVVGSQPWQQFNKSDGTGLRKCDTSSVPVEKYMSVLGYSGLSSYLPITQIAAPKAGETAYVSAAAGAVGSVACQVLRKLGCRVVGSAGSREKVEYLASLGITAFNYKEGSIAENLDKHFPDGIDIYFDNVGGEMLEAVLDRMKDFGRIVACGMISQYDVPAEQRYGVKNLFRVVTRRLKFQGYIMSDWAGNAEVMGEANRTLREWVEQGQLVTRETFLDGFESLPTAFIGLLKGENLGKMLVRCGP